uniref:TIL domain-containing protein n=1 Tax=Ascaris lumbricoides TaxID=6252 RepID=A0A0M3HPS0_ASCLU
MQCSSVSAGLKCVGSQCVLRKPCPNLRTPPPPEGCYYKSRRDNDGCVTPTLKCHQKTVQKRQIPECPRNSVYSNCTNICGYPHCATLNHVWCFPVQESFPGKKHNRMLPIDVPALQRRLSLILLARTCHVLNGPNISKTATIQEA